MIYFLLFLFSLQPLVFTQNPPIVLQNNTIVSLTSGSNPGYFNYSFSVTPDIVPISVNILLEASSGNAQGQLFSTINSSIFCTYNEYPTVMSYCQYSGWSSSYSLISINFAESDIIAIGVYLITANVNFNLKVLAYPLLQLTNDSTISINSLDSVHGYIFNRYYSYIHNPSMEESIYVIVEGETALDNAALYVSINCSNRPFTAFPSSISNYKAMFLQINFDIGNPCFMSIGVAITAYSTGFTVRTMSYPFYALSNGTQYTLDSLNSSNSYTGFYRYFSFTAKYNESPGSLNVVVNGIGSTDQTRVYANTDCLNTCTFSYYPNTLDNCFYTPYSNPFQILTVTFDTICYISIAVLVDVFDLGATVTAIVYPVMSLKNNTYTTIIPIDQMSGVQPFYRYFQYTAKIIGSLNILLEGQSTSDVGGVYAQIDCDGGCAFSNFPTQASHCFSKYESQDSFVAINLASTCNISIGVYLVKLSVSMQIKVMLYPTFNLPNGMPVMIDSLGSKVGYEIFDRYYNFQLSDTDPMGNLTIVLQGLSNGDPSELFITTNCQNNCTYNSYPSQNNYCYTSSYNTYGQVQIFLQTGCTVTINTHMMSYTFGSLLTATYYNVCPDHINKCTTCNQTLTYNTTTNGTNANYFCYGCIDYYAADPVDHLSCVFCNTSVGYFVDTQNNGYCTKCQANCFNCTNYDTCLQCDQGYLFNSISPTQSNCQCSVANCTNCTSGGQCTTCDYGFGLYSESNLCIPCLINNCLACSFDVNFNAQCTLCLNGLIYSNGSCQNCSNVVSNCSICQDSQTCQQCFQGNYLNSNGSCVACGDINTIGCVVCFDDFSCSNCVTGYYLNTDAACRPCKSLYQNCDECNIQDCIRCSDGYYYNGTTSTCILCQVNNCSQCTDPSICDICLPGYTLYNNTCISCNNGTNLSNCMTCDLSNSNKNVCLSCNPTYYMDKSGVCDTCFSISSSCENCLNSTYCNQCLVNTNIQTYLYPDPTNPGSQTCFVGCPFSTLLNMTSLICQPCYLTFGHGCVNCSSTQCTQCGSQETYFYGNTCTYCNGTNQLVVNSIYCLDNPTISYVNLTNINIFVNLQVNCSVPSQVLFIYGLFTSANSYTLSSLANVTGIIPPNDFLYTWEGKGVISTDITGFLNLTLNGPFQNSGQLYQMKLWCQASNQWGTLTTNVTSVNWTQFDNGAKIVKLQVNTSNYVNFAKKPLVALAIQKALGITREIYTDNFVPASSYQSSRRILTTETRQLQNYIYNYTFYVLPDYKIAYDYMESVVNSSLQNSTLFSLNIQNYISSIDSSSSFGIQNVSFMGTMNNTSIEQNFFPGYPAFSVQNTTIFIKYALIAAGNFYIGMRVGDNSTIVNSQGVINETMTWNEFKNQLDFAGNLLKWYNVMPSQPNVLFTMNYTGLKANTSYFLFAGAGSLGFPENLTDITMVSLETGYLSVNVTTTTTFMRKLNIGATLIILIMVATMVII